MNSIRMSLFESFKAWNPLYNRLKGGLSVSIVYKRLAVAKLSAFLDQVAL